MTVFNEIRTQTEHIITKEIILNSVLFHFHNWQTRLILFGFMKTYIPDNVRDECGSVVKTKIVELKVLIRR